MRHRCPQWPAWAVPGINIQKGQEGRPALYEADGGAWKLEAKRNIAAYLGEQLADLVECGSVVVMI